MYPVTCQAYARAVGIEVRAHGRVVRVLDTALSHSFRNPIEPFSFPSLVSSLEKSGVFLSGDRGGKVPGEFVPGRVGGSLPVGCDAPRVCYKPCETVFP